MMIFTIIIVIIKTLFSILFIIIVIIMQLASEKRNMPTKLTIRYFVTQPNGHINKAVYITTQSSRMS